MSGAFVMILALPLLLLAPLGFGVATGISQADRIITWVNSLDAQFAASPCVAGWYSGRGGKIVTAWDEIASQGRDGIAAHALPYEPDRGAAEESDVKRWRRSTKLPERFKTK